MTYFGWEVMLFVHAEGEAMGEKVIEAEAARVTRTAGPPASGCEPRRRYPERKMRRLLRVAVPLLGGMLVLAGCQNQGPSGNTERRDGFYAGAIGGWTRP
jgi:hypothetical protein